MTTLLDLLKSGATELVPIKVHPLFSDCNLWGIGFYFNGVPHIIPYWGRYNSYEDCANMLHKNCIPDWQLELIKIKLPI